MLSQLSSKVSRVGGVRAFSTHVPYILPDFSTLYNDLERDAKQNKLIKVSKLTNLFKQVTSKEELDFATQALKIYERKFIDPVENTAGEFIKACLNQDAGDVALDAFSKNARIGLFLNAGTLNKLLTYFVTKNDDASIIATYEETKKYEVVVNSKTYELVIGALVRSGDIEKATEVSQIATANNALSEDAIALLQTANTSTVAVEESSEEETESKPTSA